MTANNSQPIRPSTPLPFTGHPFKCGDRVTYKRKYGVIVSLLPATFSPVVQWSNGKTEVISPALLAFNYGRR